jgi:hypothetical protein
MKKRHRLMSLFHICALGESQPLGFRQESNGGAMFL